MGSHRFAASSAILLILAACGAGPASSEQSGQGLLLISIDALRRDHLELYGGERATMPYLAELSKEGVVFDHAWSTGACVEAPAVSLLTGCDPFVAQTPPIPLRGGGSVDQARNWRLHDALPSLPLELFANGWATAGFVDHGALSELSGFNAGFHEYTNSITTRNYPGNGSGPTRARLLDWLDGLGAERNWFSYVHLNDLERQWQVGGDALSMDFEPRAELGFVPPQGYVKPIFHALAPDREGDVQRTLGEYEAIYDSSLLRLDEELRKLIEGLRERGKLEQTTIVLVGSYGFGFGEAGLIVDAGTLSEVDLAVPLVILPAARTEIPPGGRSSALVSLVDLAPTLLQMASIPIPDGMHGHALGPLLHGREPSVREFAFARGGIHPGYAVVDTGHLFSSFRPGEGNSNLAKSWFGARRPVDPLVEGLFARGERLELGGRLHGVPDEARGQRMRAAGEAWYADIGRLRDALHLYRWKPEVRDPAILEDLRAKGLLGSLP
ncbi:MAG: arylsulfatase A-like enzyme [Planctomycetota bacterium]|jgi:arylsulfatase A-like enzyme